MKKRKLNKKRVFIFILMLIMIFALIIGGFVMSKLSSADKKGKKEDYTVEIGKSVYEIFSDLENAGYIKSALMLKVYAKVVGLKEIDAGTYEISSSWSAPKIYKTLCEKNSIKKEEITFTLNEGKNIKQLAKILNEKVGLSEEEFLNTVNDKDYVKSLIEKYWFLEDTIINDDIYYYLEGYLFPDTYNVYKDSTSKQIIEMMLDNTDKKLSEEKENITKSKYSVHELLTLASIVELESLTDDDKYDISGVFINRINNHWSLGSDITTYYASGIIVGERDLKNSEVNDCSNKYNTRCNTYYGLPIGPIANPGMVSILASLNPTKHDYFYFVSDKNGKIYLNKTYNQHTSTVSKLQREGLWYEY